MKIASLGPPPKRGFTLIELLVVIAVMVITLALIVPAFTNIKGTGDLAKAIYDTTGVLQTARSYATANNTYVWVGIFEESEAGSSTATPSAQGLAPVGTGRIVFATMASKDGTTIYSQPLTQAVTTGTMDSGMTQVIPLVKIDNMHLGVTTAGAGGGITYASRPALSSSATQEIVSPLPVSTSPYASKAPFMDAQQKYTFYTAIQFSPRGEARLNEMSQPLQPVIELGLQPTRGTTVITGSDVAAIQITGIAGNVQIYRQ